MSKLKRLEYWIKALIGKIAFIEVENKIQKKWYGSSSGGFFIAPDLVPSTGIVYSFGVGTDVSFDLEMIKQHECKVFGFDPTPKSIMWVREQKLPKEFTMQPYGIGALTERVRFNLPKNPDHVSGSALEHQMVDQQNTVEVQLKSFNDICIELKHEKIDVLKIDIEGSEYLVMESILNSGVPIKQILIETHERFFKDGKQKGEALFKMFYDCGYRIFGISDTYQEISLVKSGL